MTMVTESAAGTQDLIPFQTELLTHKESGIVKAADSCLCVQESVTLELQQWKPD